jgi:outer membrane beta-barrel protein
MRAVTRVLRTLAILLGVLAGGVRPARAAEAKPAPAPAAKASRPSQTAPPPSCLDQSITDELGDSLRPRGVQKLPFLKEHRLELVGRGGIFASDLMSSSYQYGGALLWYLGEDFGFELTLDVAPIAIDLDQPLTDFFGDPHFKTSTGYLSTANMVWAPFHFKAKTSGGSLVHGDAGFVTGAGKLFDDTAQGLAFDGGMVVELYAADWLSFRFDVRDVVLLQEAVGETRLTNNIQATLGLGIWIPFGF